MNPEQNKNTVTNPSTPEKPNYLLRRAIAVGAGALALLGIAKGAEIATNEVPKAVNAVADVFHETNEADLTGTIRETVKPGDTLEGLAVEADPATDPRVIESALRDRGVSENIQPGEIIDVPVTEAAEAAHERADE